MAVNYSTSLIFAASQNSFWATDLQTILVGIVGNSACAILGCFLLLRRMSLLGDAVSHSILAGIAGAFLLTGTTAIIPMFLGALVAGVLAAFLTQALHDVGQVAEDSSMGVVFTSMFAIGVIVISQMGRVHLDTDCILYGRLDTVSLETVQLAGFVIPKAMTTLLPALVLVVLFVLMFWKELKITSFDPQLATAIGLSAMLMHFLLMGMVATTTVASLHSVGAIVVVAMLIVPAATAHLLTDRLAKMLGIAVFSGSISAVLGCLSARWLNSNAAGMMAVVAGIQFGLAVFLAPRYGLISQLISKQRLKLRIATEDVIAMLYRREEISEQSVSREWADSTGIAATRSECTEIAGGGITGRLAVPFLLRRGELTRRDDGKLALTQKGRGQAGSLVRSHRLWEAYLDENFDLPADHLHEPASHIEHFIGPNLQDKLSESLDRPDRDPHGRPIPSDSANTLSDPITEE